MLRFYFFTILLFLSTQILAGQSSALEITPNSPHEIKPELHCTTQLPLSASLSDALASKPELWQPLKTSVIHQYLTKTPVWCHIQLKMSDQRKWLLGIENALLEDAEIYTVTPRLTHFKSGILYPFTQRPITNRYFYFPLNTPTYSNLDVFLRLNGTTVYAPVYLRTVDRMNQHESDQTNLSALVSGMLVMMIFSVLLTRNVGNQFRGQLRQRGALLIGIFVLYTAAARGYGFMHFWPTAIEWNRVSPVITLALCFTVFWNYISALYQVKFRVWHSFLYALVFLISLSALMYLIFKGNTWFVIATFLALIGLILLVLRSLLLFYASPKRTERTLWILWMLLFSATVLQHAGLFNLGVNIDYLYILLLMQLVTMFSYDVYRLIRDNQNKLVESLENTVRQEAEISILQRQREADLEAEVKERTKALADAMKDMHLINIKLRTVSSTDALTGIMNRYACDKYLESSWKSAQHMCIAIVDADHFKSVNDTYGHDVGDTCLQNLANWLTQKMTHQQTRVGRFGGEEFIIIAPDVTDDEIVVQLNNVRNHIAEQTISHHDASFSITVSIGVSSVLISESTNPRQLIKQADLALYRAKRDGRNRVMCFHDLPDQDKSRFET